VRSCLLALQASPIVASLAIEMSVLADVREGEPGNMRCARKVAELSIRTGIASVCHTMYGLQPYWTS
jgi:hypothetical protein